jgi:hypothetical protein
LVPAQIIGQTPLALPGAAGPTIEVAAGPTIEVIPFETKTLSPAPINKTAGALQEWQRKRAKEMYLANRTKPEIMEELGISLITLNEWLRMADVKEVRIRWLPKEENERIYKVHREHPDWVAIDIARELNVEPKRVTRILGARGISLPHRPGAHKIGKYTLRILEMEIEGLSDRKKAAQLKLENPGKKTPSHSGIGYFLKYLGIKRVRRGPNDDPKIRQLLEAAKRDEKIARELGEVPRIGIASDIKRNKLRSISRSGSGTMH